MQNISSRIIFIRLLASSLVVMLLFVLSLLYGSAGWSWELENWSSAIFWDLRLPRSLMALLAGTGLALAGFWMQLLFKNPLASPSVLGVTNGASLGVAFVTMAAQNIWGYNFPELTLLAAFAGSMAVLLILAVVRLRLNNLTSLLIFGVMLGHLAGALETIFQRAAARNDLPNLIYWSMGSFSKVTMIQVLWLGLSLAIVIFIVVRNHRSIDIFSLGEQIAVSMSISPNKVSNVLIFCSGLLTAVITAFCGPIAFIGLAAPHLAKLWWPFRTQLKLIPAIAITGMVIALFCDVLARFMDLPINAITSLIGAPWVMWWLYQNKTQRHG
jgi:iron complex transport system permease protein